jgi:hypothetical protein
MPNRTDLLTNSAGAVVTEITEAGDYILRTNMINPATGFTLGGRVASGAGEFSVQLWGRIAGVKTNLGAAVVVAFGAPAAWPSEYSIAGDRGITVAVTTPGTLVMEVGV